MIRTRIIKTTVSRLQETATLAGYCARRFTYLTEEQWGKEILEEKVTRNGKVARNPATDLKEGDILAYDGSGIVEPAIDAGIRLLYEDEIERLLILPRAALHNAKMVFRHPRTKQEMTFVMPDPVFLSLGKEELLPEKADVNRRNSGAKRS